MKSASVSGAGLLTAGLLPRRRLRAAAIRSSSESPNEKLGIGVVGVAGRGGANLAGVKDENIVALCDIDEKNLYNAHQSFKSAKVYADFRAMLEQKDIDAVVVSTPDHTHAVATVHALKAGFHVYCEKPLTHDVWEAHVVAKTAAEHRAVTQMGTQIHAGDNYRRVVEIVRSGAIGEIREAHAWVGKAWSGGDPPAEVQPVPAHLKYELWLGPAPARPYHKDYLPANWRRWWDFGGGTLADMGCHYMDLVHWALELENPVHVSAEGPEVHPEAAPAWVRCTYRHPARGSLPPVTVHWHDGGKRPKYFDEEGLLPAWGDGVLFVGSKGMLIANYGAYKLLPEKDYADFSPPPPFIPNSIGHHREWIEACKTGAPTTCNFKYSGALTESVLLGTVAYRSGTAFNWDRHALSTDQEAANRYLRREYREGWSL